MSDMLGIRLRMHDYRPVLIDARYLARPAMPTALDETMYRLREQIKRIIRAIIEWAERLYVEYLDELRSEMGGEG